jgi:hypothetical protein
LIDPMSSGPVISPTPLRGVSPTFIVTSELVLVITRYNFNQLETTKFNVPDYRDEFLRGYTSERAVGER